MARERGGAELEKFKSGSGEDVEIFNKYLNAAQKELLRRREVDI